MEISPASAVSGARLECSTSLSGNCRSAEEIYLRPSGYAARARDYNRSFCLDGLLWAYIRFEWGAGKVLIGIRRCIMH